MPTEPQRLLRFEGRILFLTHDAASLRRQLAGEDLPWSTALRLRDDLNTDEITPVRTMYHFDERMGDFPYVGLEVEGECPIQAGAVRAGRFAVSVSGKNRGKGSSREHAPFAELCAGIRLIIAESFDRIYEENCTNLGIFTSTDLGLVPRIRAGEEIPLDELTRRHDPITRDILHHGGLCALSAARRSGAAKQAPRARSAGRPMTRGEKLLARHVVTETGVLGVASVRPGEAHFLRPDLRVSHDYMTAMVASIYERFAGAGAEPWDRSSIVLFRDHLTFLDEVLTRPQDRDLLAAANELRSAQQRYARARGLRLHEELADRKGSDGISHQRVLESYAWPDQLIVSADSHAPHIGALGCLAIGAGATAMACSWIAGEVRTLVPETVEVVFRGRRPSSVVAKDLMLFLLARPEVRNGRTIGRIVEYSGEAVDAFGIDERATLCNLAAELGAFSGLVAPDATTVDYLVRMREANRSEVERRCEGLEPDPGAEVAARIEIDVSLLRPMVATPGDPGNGIFVDKLAGVVPVDIAFGGSCTGSKAADMDQYAEVFRRALARGQRVHPRVRCLIQAGSIQVSDYCRSRGYLEIFERAGVRFIEAGCGACCNAGPGVSGAADEVTISSMNRNFPGRSGPGKVYLASPYTVAASAIAGHIASYQEGTE